MPSPLMKQPPTALKIRCEKHRGKRPVIEAHHVSTAADFCPTTVPLLFAALSAIAVEAGRSLMASAAQPSSRAYFAAVTGSSKFRA